MVQVCLRGLGPTETTLAEVQGSLRALPTIEGRLGEGSLASSQSRDPTPIFGMPRAPAPPHLPTLRKEEWMGQSLKLLPPSQALTGHKVTGISQQRTACLRKPHQGSVKSPLGTWTGEGTAAGRVRSFPSANPPLLRPRPIAKAEPLCWVSKWGSGAVQEESQISGIHAFNQTLRRHFLPQTKCEV